MTYLPIQWVKNPVGFPSCFDAPKKSTVFNARKLCGIYGAQYAAIVFNKDVVASISRLFCFGSPSTIFRVIRAIVVASINGMMVGRSKTHVVNKVLEVVPAFAHFYASTSVSVISLIGDVIASRTHLHPYVQFIANLTSRSVPMLGFCSEDSRKPETTAALLPAVAQFLGRCGSFFSAITNTAPLNKLLSIVGLVNDSKQAKSLTREVDKFSHGLIIHPSWNFGGQSI